MFLLNFVIQDLFVLRNSCSVDCAFKSCFEFPMGQKSKSESEIMRLQLQLWVKTLSVSIFKFLLWVQQLSELLGRFIGDLSMEYSFLLHTFPCRFTFLIWVMVILGGSGNNLGLSNWVHLSSGLYGFSQAPWVLWAVEMMSNFMSGRSSYYNRVYEKIESTILELVFMGTILLLIMRFSPSVAFFLKKINNCN